MRVGLTYNLKRGEADESQDPPSCSGQSQAEWDYAETIDAVQSALQERHEVILIEADQNLYESLRRSCPDVVFNMAEGESGPCREGHVPSILEYLRNPYTASDLLTLFLCLDKVRNKEIPSVHGKPTARIL